MGNVQNKGLKKTTQIIPKSWVVLLSDDFYEQVYERHYYSQWENKYKNYWICHQFAEVCSGEANKRHVHQTERI